MQKLTSDGPIVLTEHPLPSRAARAHALKNSLGVVSAVNCLLPSTRERAKRRSPTARAGRAFLTGAKGSGIGLGFLVSA